MVLAQFSDQTLQEDKSEKEEGDPEIVELQDEETGSKEKAEEQKKDKKNKTIKRKWFIASPSDRKQGR